MKIIGPIARGNYPLFPEPAPPPPPGGDLFPNWPGFSLDIINGVGSASTSYDDYPVTARATSGDKYVDASVSSSGDGNSLANAYKTLQEGLSAVSSGQRLIVKGATYNISSTINRAASWASTVEVFAYGDDRPVLNFSGLGSTSYAINFTGANEHWKGFEVQNTPIHALRFTGSNYKIEDFIVHDACLQATDSYSAFYIFGSAATNNLVQDSIAYRIGPASATGTNVCDVLTATTTGGAGNYTTGHKFVRCLGSNGPDDVFDLFLARNTQIIDSVAAYAGIHHSAGSQGGDGNGFKLGGSKSGGTGGGNTLKGSLAIYANVTGITVNGADPHLVILNNTAVENSRGFILDPTSTDEPHIAKNNLSTDNPTYNLSKTEPINDSFNSWNLSITNGGYVAASKDWSLDAGSAAIGAGEGGVNLGASNVALAIAKYWMPIIEAA